jgi:hypothetical protein
MEVFVVRMWPDPERACGVVEHVASGRTMRFTDREAFWGFLTSAVADAAWPTPPLDLPAPRPPLE